MQEKYVSDHKQEFRHVKEDAYAVITELTNSKELSKIKETITVERGDIDMCKAIQDMIEDGKNAGRTEGKMEGEYCKLIEQIMKKIQKNKTLSQISEELEEDENVLRPLYESVLMEKPECDIQKIYEQIREYV